MFAVVETGGKQYKVSPGQTVEVERLAAAEGETVTLDRVFLVATADRTLVGTPVVAGAAVMAQVAREGRGRKIMVFKFKSKKRYRRMRGHRQNHTYLTITDIQADGASLVPGEERAAIMARSLRETGVAVDEIARAEAVGDEGEVERAEEALEAGE
jgi:large subunit ribosomal protein L21